MARLTPDLCVIGAGSGGLSVAAAAAAFGVPVVLIEKGDMGGECLNAGCVPSKALLAAAKHAQAHRDSAVFGVAGREPEIDFARVRAHVHEVIAAIAPNDSQARFEGLGVTVIRAAARFSSPREVVAGEHTIAARRFVIATGSRPAIPPIDGIADVPYLTNETLFDLDILPDHLIILGAGAVGCEMAQAFCRLGSAVTLIEAVKPLGRDDPEAVAVVLDALRREGVRVLTGEPASRVRRAGRGLAVDVGGQSVEGSHLLVAAGRTPVVEGLDLDAAGVLHSSRGISLDRGMRSLGNRRVYAVGDVAGGVQLTHAANYQAGLVIRNALFRLPVKLDRAAIPSCVYTDPELAQAGLTEAAARALHADVKVLTTPFAHNDRAQAERHTDGFLKVVTTKRGRILGATIVGPGAGELAITWQFAVAQRANIRSFTSFVAPYPTLGEAGKRAAYGFFAASLTSPLVRGMIRLLRHLS